MSFDKIFTQGTLVDINIRVWRAQISLKAEEIGLKDENIPAYFELGKKRLVPKDLLSKFYSLENTARQTLFRYSYPFAFGDARFVPKKCLLEFTKRFDEYIRQFNDLRDQFIANYDRNRFEMRKHFTEAAEISYRNALSMLSHDTQTKELGMTENEYKNNYIDKIERNYPSPEELARKFKMEYHVFQVALPDLTQITYDDITEQDSKIRLLENIQKKNIVKKVNSFFTDSIIELRSRVINSLDLFEKALQGRFGQISIEHMKNILDTYEKMCFFDDPVFMVHVNLFRDKCLKCYNSRTIRDSEVIKSMIFEEIAKLRAVAKDKTIINEITRNFEEKMNL